MESGNGGDANARDAKPRMTKNANAPNIHFAGVIITSFIILVVFNFASLYLL